MFFLSPVRWRWLFILGVAVLFRAKAQGITVSGRVTESDTAPVAGITISVFQVGGELPTFTAQTGADGRWAVSDALLTGNIRVEASSASFSLSPASRDSFTFADLPNQDFTATPTFPRPNLNVLSGAQVPVFNGDTYTFPVITRGRTTTPSFVLTNDGTLPLSLSSLTVTGAQAAEFSADRLTPGTLRPGEFAAVNVLFAPLADGVRTATMVIRSDDPNENPYLVQLIGIAVSLEVTNTADSGPGSLRQALANAALTDGNDQIVVHPSLSGQTITVRSEISITATGRVILDAKALPGGLTLTGGNTRIFRVAGTSLEVAGINFIAGRSASLGEFASGGAIYTEGALSAVGCTFSFNRSPYFGGAIASVSSDALLTVSNCFFFGNSSANGGAIACWGDALITHSTFRGNQATRGGALYTQSPGTILTRSTFNGNAAAAGGAIVYITSVTLKHCTISGNSAEAGGGLYSFLPGTAQCDFSIVAGNRGSTTDIDGLVVNNSSVIGGSPMLAPLDDYGGALQTMALLSGSPARGLAAESSSTTDQRGFPIVGAPDAGAYEAGTFENFNAFIWESLPDQATAAEHAPGVDFDRDGADNLAEWIALTDPANAASVFRITNVVAATNSVRVTFPASAARHYRVETSTNLINWTPRQDISGAVGNSITVPFAPNAAPPVLFLRVRAAP